MPAVAQSFKLWDSQLTQSAIGQLKQVSHVPRLPRFIKAKAICSA